MNRIDDTLHIAIASAINAGICADVQDRMDYTNSDAKNYVFSMTEGYKLEKTIEFIESRIRDYNRASNHHSSRK